MTNQPLDDELRAMAEQIVAGPDDVAAFAAAHAEEYRRRRAAVLSLLHADALAAGDAREIDEQHPALAGLRAELRDRLQRLLAWARTGGRL